MQPLYFVKHADGSYSEADPQPQLLTTSGSPETPEAASGYGLEMASAGDGSVEEAYALQQ